MAQGSDIFEVSKILSRKIINGRRLYLIRWKNFGPAEDTWEPLKNLESCRKLIKSFEENNKDLIQKLKAKKKKKVDKNDKGISKLKKKTVSKSKVLSSKLVQNKLKKAKGYKDKLVTSNTKRKRKSLESEDSSSSDEEILYSLNEDVLKESSKSKANGFLVSKKESRKLKKLKLDIKKATSTNSNSSSSGCMANGKGTPKSRMRLIDSMKSKVFQTAHRPVSPVSGFNSVKSLTDTSQMCGGMADTSPNAGRPASIMDSYFGDIPAASMVPMIPSSPSAISYKMLLDNLPLQLHPKKDPKREKPDSDDEETVVERRQSVRSSECAFRYKDIVVKKCHCYTQIWLFSNTKQKNALNPQVIQEIISAMNYAKYDDSRLIMFSSLGSMFCSGVDLHFLLGEDRKVAARKMVDAIRDLTKTFITFPKPVVAVVNGPAIGLGVGLLPLCDVIYASDKASCYLPYGRLGQTPEGGLSFTLPHRIGHPMANELLFAGRKITAIEAYQLGLVSQVFWPTSMMQEVIPRVQNMALNSAKAQEATKLLIRSHQRTKLELTSETECNLLYDRWTSSECQRSIMSYLEDEKNLVL